MGVAFSPGDKQLPGCWEIPGGGCDDDDESILHAVARELWEEVGLTTTRIGPLVGNPLCYPVWEADL